MRIAAYKVDVASDRRRRENVQGTFFVLLCLKPPAIYTKTKAQNYEKG